MTSQILLTGAGFSRNWGGWLGSEVTEYLLGVRTLNRRIRELLWNSREQGGFERVLGILQADQSLSDFWKLSEALENMFDVMNAGFTEPLDASMHHGLHVTSLLASFDAIFTLNQDLLLERQYSPTFQGWYRPGLVPVDERWTRGTDRKLWTGASQDALQLRTTGEQPYVKLHGSIDFRQDLHPEGSGPLVPILVQGTNKASRIGDSELLTWYRRLFEDHLKAPDTRLMIIGYGFADEHINSILRNAALGGQLSIFVVDPRGLDALVGGPSDLVGYTMGASRRPLRETFAGRGSVELAKFSLFQRG